MGDQEGVVNTVEIQTMTEQEIVAILVVQNKITSDAVEKLFRDGFNSMQAISLIDMDDLSRTTYFNFGRETKRHGEYNRKQRGGA